MLDSRRNEDHVVAANDAPLAGDLHRTLALEHVIDLFLDLVSMRRDIGHRLVARNPVVDVDRAFVLRHDQGLRQRTAEMVGELPPGHLGDVLDAGAALARLAHRLRRHLCLARLHRSILACRRSDKGLVDVAVTADAEEIENLFADQGGAPRRPVEPVIGFNNIVCQPTLSQTPRAAGRARCCQRQSRPISSAVTLCVSQPLDSKSTSVAAIAGAVSGVMRPDASVTRRPPTRATARRSSSRLMLSSSTASTGKCNASSSCCKVSTSSSILTGCPMAARARAPAASRPPAAAT